MARAKLKKLVADLTTAKNTVEQYERELDDVKKTRDVSRPASGTLPDTVLILLCAECRSGSSKRRLFAPARKSTS